MNCLVSTQVMRAEFAAHPEKIPACLGPVETAEIKAHLKRTAVASGRVPFAPPRAANVKNADEVDGDWARLSAAVAVYCKCRGYEHKISPVPEACARATGPPPKPKRITIAVLSFLDRERGRLKQTVCHYATLPLIVDSVLVQWNGAAPSAPGFDCGPTAAAVVVTTFSDNTLLNRYRGLPTATKTILLQDDDVRYSARALRAFASAAVLFPDAILGVQGRLALFSEVSPGVYMNPDKKGNQRIEGQYNMLTGTTSVLSAATAASFLSSIPPRSRDFVAKGNRPTCEDMTLHFHAATRAPGPKAPPPVWLEFDAPDAAELPATAAAGATGEMHLDVSNWNVKRAACVDRLAEEFETFPLTRSVCRIDLRGAPAAAARSYGSATTSRKTAAAKPTGGTMRGTQDGTVRRGHAEAHLVEHKTQTARKYLVPKKTKRVARALTPAGARASPKAR